LGVGTQYLEALFWRDQIMQHRKKLNGLSLPGTSAGVADIQVGALLRDNKYATAEIARLKLELAQARDELDKLADATSDFVRFML
jgi:hypothetical protein